MDNSEQTLEEIVQNWLKDVQRRGVELYARNQVNTILYLSFAAKDELRFSVEIDFAVRDIRVEITGPHLSSVIRKTLLLDAQSLRWLAKRMCPIGEGQVVVPVYLLAELAVLCHAYQRLVQDYARDHGGRHTSNAVQEIESELREYLTPEEQQRTDNPYLRTRKVEAHS